ncbi:MAG: SRPBCC family protein [Bacteroidales bacterium]|nr:SRPBCC family protein [Bacteroidales bacterium]
MKALRYFFLTILGLIVLLLVVALFVPKQFKVEREVTINQPDSVVFDYVKYLKNQDNFSVWNQMDPNMKQTFKGTDGTVGFAAAWESNNKNVGVGEQEIVSIDPGKRIDFALRFKKPQEAENDAYFITQSVNDSTTSITWGISGEMPYPMNLLMLVYNMDEMVGPDLHKGLNNLKVILDKK